MAIVGGEPEMVTASVRLADGSLRHLTMQRRPKKVTVWPKSSFSPAGLEHIRGYAVICPHGAVSALDERQEGKTWVFRYDCFEL